MNLSWRAAKIIFFAGLVASSALCLVLGITLPILQLTRFYLWTDTFSILSVIWTLYTDQELLLAGILLLFSIIFPVLKILCLITASIYVKGHLIRRDRLFVYLDWLGKWSMLDVLVLALTVFYAKSTGLAEATSLPGIYFFTASVILTMIATAQIKRL